MEFFYELQKIMTRFGFRQINDKTEYLWIRAQQDRLLMVELIPEVLPGQTRLSLAQQEKRIQEAERQLMLKYGQKTERLSLMIFKGMPMEEIIQGLEDYPNIWCLDYKNGRLLIYENQITDFYGLRKPLEQFMQEYQIREKAEERAEISKMIRPVNTIIVGVNILVFIILSLIGNVLDAEFMADHGALVWENIIMQGEYYRLFTSMFLHFGLEHLLQNMLILMLVGWRLEKIVGKVRYLVIYLGAGLAASITSLFITLANEPYTVSAGASGAIFGVLGGLLFLIVKDAVQKGRKKIREIGLTGMIFMIVSALSYGFFSTGVDNAAHIGGLCAGFIVTGILSFGL